MARTKAFNPDEKLHQAMMLFWVKGYDGTSLQDLVTTLELNRFSIYNTYGDKKSLYFKALQRYKTVIFDPLLEPLKTEQDGMTRLTAYFNNLVEKLCMGPGNAGCFLQNAAQETTLEDPDIQSFSVRVFKELAKALHQTLEDAQSGGQLKRHRDINACTEFLVMQVQAMIMLRKMVGKTRLRKNVDFLLEELQHW